MKSGGALASGAPLKSRAVLKNTKPLKAVKKKITGRSKKAIAFEAEYQAIRPSIIERAKGKCEIGVVCGGHATPVHVHHAQVGRSHGGSNDPEKLFATCIACHEWTHSGQNRKEPKLFLVSPKGMLLTTRRKHGTIVP